MFVRCGTNIPLFEGKPIITVFRFISNACTKCKIGLLLEMQGVCVPKKRNQAYTCLITPIDKCILQNHTAEKFRNIETISLKI